MIELFKKMLLIRYAEQILADHYKLQEIRTPVHFGIGQEASAVGVCAALRQEDVIFSHHRCHNHYLAKGGDLNRFVAELYGRESGCSQGRGGSVHLTDSQAGVVATSAILGQMIPVAVGAALSFKMDKKPNVAVTFFGDGSFDEGIVYESLNYAAIQKLPVIFVCENNLYSTETKLDIRKKPGTEFVDRVKAFGIPSYKVDGNDVIAVHTVASKAVEECRKGNGPVFLECDTYRWLEHVGPYFDYELHRTYRTQEEIEQWQERCPIALMSKHLSENGIVSLTEQETYHAYYEKIVRDAVLQAQLSPWPATEAILNNIY